MVTHEPVDHTDPVWSPDGQTVAVKIPNRNGLCSQLGLVDVETGETKLVGPRDGTLAQWAWSPDGSRIVFAGDESQTWQTDRFAAAVCGAPCFDLESMWGTSDIDHIFGTLLWGGAPHEIPEWYAAHSPSNFAHRAKTPTLIVHGEADDRCPIGQGEQLFVALLGAGVETEFVRYPGASHLFLRTGPAAHRQDFLERVVAWFRDHLGGPA